MQPPQPIVTELTKPYWQAVAQGELALQYCEPCSHWIHFPEPRCPKCGNRKLEFNPVGGRGTVESFSVIHRSFVEGFGPEPYVIAWVSLPEQVGLRVMCNIINSDVDAIEINANVSLCFEQRGGFGQLPQFTLSQSTLPLKTLSSKIRSPHHLTESDTD